MQTSPAWIPSREPVARSMAVRWAVCCYSSTSSTFHDPTSPSKPRQQLSTGGAAEVGQLPTPQCVISLLGNFYLKTPQQAAQDFSELPCSPSLFPILFSLPVPFWSVSTTGWSLCWPLVFSPFTLHRYFSRPNLISLQYLLLQIPKLMQQLKEV